MGVKVVKRKYNELYRTEDTNWLIGNVGDWQKLNLQVEVGIDLYASSQVQIGIDYVQNYFKLLNGKKWSDYGFDLGQVVTLKYLLEKDTDGNGQIDLITPVETTFTITNLYDDIMEVQETIDIENIETIPANYGTKKISKVVFYVEEEPEGMSIQYQHISNDDFETKNLVSVIDQTTTELICNNIKQTPTGVWTGLTPIGKQSGMSIRTGKIRRINPINPDSLFADLKNVTQDTLTIATNRTSFFQPTLGYDERMKPIPMSSTSTLPPTYQNVTDNNYHNQQAFSGTYASGMASQVFLYNASGSYAQSISISTQFRIMFTNADFFIPNYMRLVLVRYTGGTALTLSSITELKRWNNVRAIQGQTLTHSEIRNLTINDGDSYGLFIEFHHPKDPTYSVQKFIGVKIEETELLFSAKNESFQSTSDDYKKYYEIELEYMISSLFENISNLQDLEWPAYLGGDGSLTDNFDIKFFPKWNNPNTLIKNDLSHTERLGNTGWFNENFNELLNNFVVESVEYFDTNGNPATALDYYSQTKVNIVVSGVTNVTTDTECGYGFAWIPKYDTDYKNLDTPFYRNIFTNTGNNLDGFKVGTFNAGPYYGNGINGIAIDSKNVKFTDLGAGKIGFEIILMPNSNFYGEFDQKGVDDRNYILWLSIADSTLIRNFSNRVSLLVDLNTMVKSVPPAGPFADLQNSFIEHPFLETTQGVAELDGFVQDDVLCKIPFQINYLTQTIKKIRFGVEAFNPSNSTSKILEKYDINTTVFPLNNSGIPQINVDTIRGFKLESGNNKNWIKINRELSLDTTSKAGYLAFYAFKIRYEDWIQMLGVPADFFDSTELNNGFNNDWYHYFETIGWKINFYVEIDSEEGGVLKRYKNQFQFKVRDYDSNDVVDTEHRYYRQSDNTSLPVTTDTVYNKPLGVILTNEPTRIEIDFEITDNGTWDLNNIYAVTTLEIDRGGGILEMRQLSSVWGAESDNPLKPVPGATKLRIVIDGTGKIATTKCLVEPSLLETAEKYRVTGRIGCYVGGEPVDFGKYEAKYETKYE